MEYFLSLVIFFPAVAAVLGFLIDEASIKTYAVTMSFIEFVLSLVLWILYEPVDGIAFSVLHTFISE